MEPIVVSTDVARDAWDGFVQAHPQASGYHSWIWREVFEEAFGHDTRYLGARRAGQLVGVLPLVVLRSWLFGRFLTSLPFVNYGGVLAADADAEDAGLALVDSATTFARSIGAAHVELRHTTRRFAGLPCRTHKVAMILPLASNRDDAWNGLDRKVRNQIRKADRSGLRVEAGGLELVDAFYQVFAHNMRDLGTPVYPRKLFRAILTRLADRAMCVVVTSGQTPVAAAVALIWRDTIEVPWAASLKQYRAVSANTLLCWTMLEHAVDAGLARFDFGRSSPGSGTYRFKQQWGAVPAPLYWEYALTRGRALPDLGPTNPRFAPAIAAWKRLPLRVTTAIGPHIVRSLP